MTVDSKLCLTSKGKGKLVRKIRVREIGGKIDWGGETTFGSSYRKVKKLRVNRRTFIIFRHIFVGTHAGSLPCYGSLIPKSRSHVTLTAFFDIELLFHGHALNMSMCFHPLSILYIYSPFGRYYNLSTRNSFYNSLWLLSGYKFSHTSTAILSLQPCWISAHLR